MINTILGNRNSRTPIKIKDATELIEKIGDLWLTGCDISYEFTVIVGKSINGWVVLMEVSINFLLVLPTKAAIGRFTAR